MLQGLLFSQYECLRCRTPARVHKFYRICSNCYRTCTANPKEGRLWFFGNRDVDEEAATRHPPGSPEKIRLMRKRHIEGLDIFNGDDNVVVDWDRVDLVGMLSEAIQREAGRTGVERDGKHWRARPMAGGHKHSLGEFDTEWKALGMVEWFWIGWPGLPSDATKEQIEKARERDADQSRSKARERRGREKRSRAKSEATPLFG